MEPQYKVNEITEINKVNQKILQQILADMTVDNISPIKKNIPTTPRSANTSFTTLNNKIQLKNSPLYKQLRQCIENMIQETSKTINSQNNPQQIMNLNKFLVKGVNSSLTKLDEITGLKMKRIVLEKQVSNHFNNIRKNLQQVKANCQNEISIKGIKNQPQKLVPVTKCIAITVQNNALSNQPTIKTSASSNLTDLEDFLKSVDFSANILFTKINQCIQQKKQQSKSTQIQINTHNATLQTLQQSIKKKQAQLKDMKTQLQRAISQKQQQIQNMKKTQSLLNKSYTQMQLKYKQAIDYEKLSKKYENLETELSKSKDHLKTEKQFSEKLSKQNQSLKKTIEQQKVEITKNINSISQHKREKQKLTNEISSLTKDKKDLITKLQQQTLSVEKSSFVMENIKVENGKQIVKYRELIQKLEKERFINANKISELILQNQTLKAGIEQIRINSNNLAARDIDLSEEIQKLRIGLKIEREKVVKSEENAKSLNDKLKRSIDQIDAKNDELQQFNIRNKQLTNKLSEFKTMEVENQLLQNKNANLQSEIQQINLEIEQLKKQHQKDVENERSTNKLKRENEKNFIQLLQKLKKTESDLKAQSDLVKQLSLQLEKNKKQFSEQLQAKHKQLKDAQKRSEQNSFEINKQLKYYRQAYQNLVMSQQPQNGKVSQNKLKNHMDKIQKEHSRKTSKFFSFFSSQKTQNQQDLENQLNYLKEKTQQKSIQVNKLFKKQRESLQKQKRSLQEQLQEAKRKIRQLENQLNRIRPNTS